MGAMGRKVQLGLGVRVGRARQFEQLTCSMNHTHVGSGGPCGFRDVDGFRIPVEGWMPAGEQRVTDNEMLTLTSRQRLLPGGAGVG
jgi:hypothetical protein